MFSVGFAEELVNKDMIKLSNLLANHLHSYIMSGSAVNEGLAPGMFSPP
jgi:hypothetical protein